MGSFYLYLLPILGGIAVSVQVVLNGVLEKNVGRLWTIFVSHIGGAILAILFILAQFTVGQSELFASGFKNTPWYSLFGGLFGFLTVFFVLIPMRHLPVAVIIAFVTIGQLVFSVIADHYGLFGMVKVPFTVSRMLGVVALTVGAFLIKR